MGNDKFSEWHGIKRKEVDWYPVVDEEKCIGCGLCTITCGRKVYKYDFASKKTKVFNPYNCLVGCQTCANLCPSGAISFAEEGTTPAEKAQGIVRKYNIVKIAKKELESKKDELEFVKEE